MLFVLYDDTGLAAWSPFGGGINMPTLQKLADNGLMYSQWHTTALCSPTRSTLLTGRNHHLNGCACITEGSNGFPGHMARIPEQCATIGQILQDGGWSTFWLGKNHNVPETDVALGASKKSWPLSMGFDRYYGFIGGETNNWYPDLIEDNHAIEPPCSPEEGYHLSKDLADQALKMIKDQKAGNPSKPWYMWFCPGANHAPHHAPQEYIDKYKGKFDAGYEAYREWVLPRMIAKGILPPDTKLTPMNPLPDDVALPADHVRPWNSLNADEKKLFSRLMEVYAGFSEYTDAQVGRIIDYLEQSGQLENTVVIYCADNGASGEGSPNGSVNENKFFNGYPDELSENMKLIDKLGGPDTYEHFPTGWAMATSAPFKMFKRYAEYAGGTCDPLVISWPKGIKARGEVRNQYHHSTDIVPTILDICGLEMPKVYKGVEQYPLSGVSMKYTFDAKPDAPTQKKRQYYAMLGTRGIWEDGWKAVALHVPFQGRGNFDKDAWELYHVDVDRAESKNLAKEHPEKLQALIKAWFEEAEKNFVLPLDDRNATEILTTPRPTEEEPRERYVYYPGTSADSGECRRQRARTLVQDPRRRRGRSGLLGRDLRARVALRRSRVVHRRQEAALRLQLPRHPAGAAVRLTGTQARQVHAGHGVHPGEGGSEPRVVGTTKLYVNDKVVAEGPMRAQVGKFTLSGDGLCIGYDSGDAVSALYKTPGEFKGGTIQFVGVTTEKAQYLDLETLAMAAMAVD